MGNESTVRSILANFETMNRESRVAAIFKLAKEGYSNAEIAATLGVFESSVRNFLSKGDEVADHFNRSNLPLDKGKKYICYNCDEIVQWSENENAWVHEDLTINCSTMKATPSNVMVYEEGR